MKSHGARVSPPAAMSNMEPESRIQGPDVLRFNFLSILNSIGARVLVPVRKDPAAMPDVKRGPEFPSIPGSGFNFISVLTFPRCGRHTPAPCTYD